MKKKLLGLLMVIPFIASCGSNNKQLVEVCENNPRCSGCVEYIEIEKAIVDSKGRAYAFIGYVGTEGHTHKLYLKR